MSWERRLREMVFAGGALATAACSAASQSGALDAGGQPADATTDQVANDQAANEEVSAGQCCNANPDPCCEYEFCEASITPQCACQLEGGTWNPYAGYDALQLVGACETPAGDAEQPDGDSAASDGGTPDAPEGGADGS